MRIYALLASILLILSLYTFGCSQKVNKEEILVSFDNQFITSSEFEKNISELPAWKQDRYKDKAGKTKYLEELAEERLLSLAAIESNLHKEPETVKQVNEYRDQLVLKELVKVEVDDKLKVTDADLEKYYADNMKEYIEPEKVAVTEITLKDEAKANELMEKMKGGEDFTALAKEMDAKGESFGPGSGNEGKTRPFSRDSYSSAKEFVDKAFSLQPGEMSDIIVQPMGKDTFYMIIRKDEHNPSKQKELSEVKDDVQRSVEREKKKERLNQWLENIKKERNFQLYLDRIPKVEVKEEVSKESEEKVEQKESQKSMTQEEKKEVQESSEKEQPDEKTE